MKLNLIKKTYSRLLHHLVFTLIFIITSLFTLLIINLPSSQANTNNTPSVGNIIVNTLDNINDDTDGKCSLYEAVQAANNDNPYNECPAGNGADLITFSVSGIIIIDTELNINTEIALLGPIALNDDDSSLIFQVSSNGMLSLSTLTLQNGDGTGGATDNCTGDFTSLGHNIDNGSSCNFSHSTSLNNTDPLLDSLDFNGRPIVSLLTHALLPNSPAIDAAGPSTYTIQVFNPTPGGGISNQLNFTVFSNEIPVYIPLVLK